MVFLPAPPLPPPLTLPLVGRRESASNFGGFGGKPGSARRCRWALMGVELVSRLVAWLVGLLDS